MSEILKYVLENLKSLSGFHILLVLLLSGLATTVSTKLLLGFFQSRFEAQRDLLGLRESVLAELKDRVNEREQAITRIEAELDSAKANADRALEQAKEGTDRTRWLEQAVEALAETGIAFQESFYNLERIYLLMRLFDSSRGVVFLYFSMAVLVGDEVSNARELHRRLEAVSRQFTPLDREIPTFPLPLHGQFRKGVKAPKEISSFPFFSVEEELRTVSSSALAGVARLRRRITKDKH